MAGAVETLRLQLSLSRGLGAQEVPGNGKRAVSRRLRSTLNAWQGLVTRDLSGRLISSQIRCCSNGVRRGQFSLWNQKRVSPVPWPTYVLPSLEQRLLRGTAAALGHVTGDLLVTGEPPPCALFCGGTRGRCGWS